LKFLMEKSVLNIM